MTLARPREAALHEAATRLFRQRGFHATSMQDLAEDLGMNRGSLYHYIEAKDDLLWAIVNGAMERLDGAVRPILEGPDPIPERLERAIAAHLAFAAEHGDELALVQIELRALTPDRRAMLVGQRDAYEAAWREAIRQGVGRRLHPPGRRAARDHRHPLGLQLVHPVVPARRPPRRAGHRPGVRRPVPRRAEGRVPMIPRMRSVVVLGAGTMGAQIACLLAGAGAKVRLLDLDEATAADGLARALKLRPAPTYRPQDVAHIRTGSFDELPAAASDADWILEAVVERLEPKRALFARVDEALSEAARRPWPIVSTNTSGISIAALAAGRSDDFRRAFLGTHFFNPPRYTRLLELIPIATTAPHVIETLEAYAPRHLGKGTVRAKDTPAFIANRLGVYGLQRALALAQELGLGVDEVDELTGPLIGRPRSATFRTLDVVGLDVAVAVADHCHADLPDDPQREVFVVAPILRQLIERGSLGEKAGAGFFKREGGEILALDLATGDYRPRRRISSATVEAARNERDLGARLRLLVAGDDAASRFLWRAMSDGITYAADVAGEIAGDLPTIDRAMRLGFGWQLGPFETWDALGVAATVERLRRGGPRRATPRRGDGRGRWAVHRRRSVDPGRPERGGRAPWQCGGLRSRAWRWHPRARAARQAQHHRCGHAGHGPPGDRPRRDALRRAGHRHGGRRLLGRGQPGADARRR